MAAAHVTGILALALSYLKKKGGRLNPEQIINIMKETAFMPGINGGDVDSLI